MTILLFPMVKSTRGQLSYAFIVIATSPTIMMCLNCPPFASVVNSLSGWDSSDGQNKVLLLSVKSMNAVGDGKQRARKFEISLNFPFTVSGLCVSAEKREGREGRDTVYCVTIDGGETAGLLLSEVG